MIFRPFFSYNGCEEREAITFDIPLHDHDLAFYTTMA
jgi:hypothetical protein